jgi:hypothetical protein
MKMSATVPRGGGGGGGESVAACAVFYYRDLAGHLDSFGKYCLSPKKRDGHAAYC